MGGRCIKGLCGSRMDGAAGMRTQDLSGMEVAQVGQVY